MEHVGYRNNLQTKRIEVDPERGPLVTKLFEWYARGTLSLKAVTMKAALHGLTHPRNGRRLARSEIHRILHNPLYYGDFRWNGKLYKGSHQPVITRELFEEVLSVFEEGNRPRYSKRRHAFAGLIDCAQHHRALFDEPLCSDDYRRATDDGRGRRDRRAHGSRPSRMPLITESRR